MRLTHFIFLLFITTFFGCKDKPLGVSRIEGKQIPVADSIIGDPSIEAYVKPFREGIKADLDSTLAYAPNTLSKSDGEFNTAIGNLMADAVYEQASPVFERRTGHKIDAVLLNYGGIRGLLPKGNVSKRTAYEIMPFENSIMVVTMKGSAIKDLMHYLLKAKAAHPISGLKLSMDADFKLVNATINNNPIDANKTYYVATSDYLFHGGDNMDFFKDNEGSTLLNYKIRNALIDYFIKKDTINPKRDDRFIQIK
ncbi:5'-nucleotidase [Gaetbulibacter aestuarii]|uniref:5'-nucleotidase n=1 Tax=Gaetbulibacter aestuarii TaxID=1502358 RepID=A0ABW7N1P4_9FLAO